MPPMTRANSPTIKVPENLVTDLRSSSPTKNRASSPKTSSPTKQTSKRKHRVFKSLFKPRTSPLDIETLIKQKHPMRGFFILFWVSMTAKFFLTMYENWKHNGEVISLNLASIMFKNIQSGLFYDFVMILSLFYVIPYQKLIGMGIIPLALARPIQHGIQACWFGYFTYIAFVQDWGWTATGAFSMHSIAMLMKQHSYTAYNIDLRHKLIRYTGLKAANDENKRTDGNPLASEEEEEMNDLYAELNSGDEMFPGNQTLFNFIDYLAIPSLVYELHFPRTARFRLWYFSERCLSTFVSISFMYMIVEHQIIPVASQMKNQTFLDSIAELMIPFMACYILTFYIIFECICNAFAELTCFADREFYGDWWNSASYGDFARLWNKPVHQFLLRHCYHESREKLKISKTDATFFTFFLSSLMHELVFVLIGKKVRLYMFTMQMVQLPLIFMSSLPIFKGRELAGNVFFWFGMYVGPPMLAVAYLREYYIGNA